MSLKSIHRIVVTRVTKHYIMRAYWEREDKTPRILILRNCLNGHLYSSASIFLGTHWIGDWVGPRIGLETDDIKMDLKETESECEDWIGLTQKTVWWIQ